jgi:hypothetical protein
MGERRPRPAHARAPGGAAKPWSLKPGRPSLSGPCALSWRREFGGALPVRLPRSGRGRRGRRLLQATAQALTAQHPMSSPRPSKPPLPYKTKQNREAAAWPLAAEKETTIFMCAASGARRPGCGKEARGRVSRAALRRRSAPAGARPRLRSPPCGPAQLPKPVASSVERWLIPQTQEVPPPV